MNVGVIHRSPAPLVNLGHAGRLERARKHSQMTAGRLSSASGTIPATTNLIGLPGSEQQVMHIDVTWVNVQHFRV